MLIKNRKGFSLTELLIVIALLGILSPLMFYIMVFGIEDYSTTTKYLDQQYTVIEVSRLIRQDFEEAKKLTLYDEDGDNKIEMVKFEFSDTPTREPKAWKFDSDSLKLYVGATASYNTVTFDTVINNLDIGNSYFDVDSTSERFILSIRPKELNNKKYRGRNVNENIITEFSVRYKQLEIIKP